MLDIYGYRYIYGADWDSFDDFPVELYDVDDTVMEYSITEREQS